MLWVKFEDSVNDCWKETLKICKNIEKYRNSLFELELSESIQLKLE